MNGAELYASFAQSHEIVQNSKIFSQFLGEMSRTGQLKLINAERDFHIFIEKRRELYAINKPKYQNYFAKSQPLEKIYERSQRLRTTEHIKGLLLEGLNPFAGSNLLSSEERAILSKNGSFLRDELPDPGIAATYSVYEKISLVDGERDARVFGDISTRLFCNHYTTEHNLISPTGIYNDPLIEDFSYFPHFDISVNFCFLRRLGLEPLITQRPYERDYLTFINHPDYWSFAEMKELFFEAMVRFLKSNREEISYCEPYKKFIRGFLFLTPSRRYSNEPARFAEILSVSLAKSIEKDGKMAEALGSDGLKSIGRHKVVIFTATDVEDEVLSSELLSEGFKRAETDFFEDIAFNVYTYYNTIHVYHVRTGAGSGGVHGSTIASLKFLSMSGLSYAISVGICFGVDAGKQKFGDVLVSDSVLPYELGAARGGTLQPRGIPIPSDNMAVGYARSARSQFGGDFNIQVGPILSGEKLVDDPDFKRRLMDIFPRAIGGEMECAGLAATAFARKVPFVMFKGICDFAEGKNDSYQEMAAKNACRLAISMVNARWSKK
ncbi:hypothetical protein NKJ74_14765 [Mesorhizobium sp. M0046]|uniref:5'-methylthioadenosine/S-adenosylhomocysteine nucleosidase family protein n=1 Tax=Mesorhizobium sp. M0046 TaxID=2956858 RepID=UPI00333A8C21